MGVPLPLRAMCHSTWLVCQRLPRAKDFPPSLSWSPRPRSTTLPPVSNIPLGLEVPYWTELSISLATPPRPCPWATQTWRSRDWGPWPPTRALAPPACFCGPSRSCTCGGVTVPSRTNDWLRADAHGGCRALPSFVALPAWARVQPPRSCARHHPCGIATQGPNSHSHRARDVPMNFRTPTLVTLLRFSLQAASQMAHVCSLAHKRSPAQASTCLRRASKCPSASILN